MTLWQTTSLELQTHPLRALDANFVQPSSPYVFTHILLSWPCFKIRGFLVAGFHQCRCDHTVRHLLMLKARKLAVFFICCTLSWSKFSGTTAAAVTLSVAPFLTLLQKTLISTSWKPTLNKLFILESPCWDSRTNLSLAVVPLSVNVSSQSSSQSSSQV